MGLKKTLKKAAKAAALVGGAYLASKYLGNKKSKAKSDLAATEDNKDAVIKAVTTPVVKKRTKPIMAPNSWTDAYGNKSSTEGMQNEDGSDFGMGDMDGAKKGGSAGRAKRSTITGVAVRGFGRALKGKR